MFFEINRSRGKFYLANAVTADIYGVLYVIFRAGPIGKLVGSHFPGVGMGVLLTLLTLGLYPGVVLSVLAYKLAPAAYPSLGHKVLAFNLASLVTALLSGGFFIVISIALWAHAVWLLADAANGVAMDKAPNNSFKPMPSGTV